jgi:triphosphoribosyl-dephospho-CoA synthase
VSSFKPGNVSTESPGHGMQADDFLLSAEHSAAVIVQPNTTLGQRILLSVLATRRRVHCNTNLGIILMAAPLMQACLDHPHMPLSEAIRKVLAATSLEDTENVYRAIRVAAPGGLGELPEHDVAQPACLPLVPAMRQAAERDFIARQYATDFADLFDDIVPFFSAALGRHELFEPAVTETFLYLLSRYPDTHIERKHGSKTAGWVSEQARKVLRNYEDTDSHEIAWGYLHHFDRLLKARGVNPGTSADLCVAAVISHRLQQQAKTDTGMSPANPRIIRPDRIETPLSLTT